MITIDGSQGEGGGQILRTSLSLALVTGQAFRIENIRANRSRPGLLRQHLGAVQVAARVGSADTSGAELGSRVLEFRPGPVTAGEYHVAIGTAGSACLVLQTVLPALLVSRGPSRLVLEGGTHNPHAPPHDFLAKSFLPLVRRMGAAVEVGLERHGFFPAGGGRLWATITPAAKLEPIGLLDRGEFVARRARAFVAHLPERIAERELDIVREELGWHEDECEIVTVTDSAGPGNVLSLEYESINVMEITTSFGERAVRSATVAHRAVGAMRAYLAGGVPVGEHLADQLVLPLALAGGGGFLTLAPSQHLRTNIDVVRRFLDVPIEIVEPSAGRGWHVRVGGS